MPSGNDLFDIHFRNKYLKKIKTGAHREIWGGFQVDLRPGWPGRRNPGSKVLIFPSISYSSFLFSRYDLTVPFARYCAMNKISNIKRYHMAKVNLAEKIPEVQFNSCLAAGLQKRQPKHIARPVERVLPVWLWHRRGVWCHDPWCWMRQDRQWNPQRSWCRQVCHQGWLGAETCLKSSKLSCQVNHRKILDGIFEVCGVATDMFRCICSAVDKLDKVYIQFCLLLCYLSPLQSPWDEVRREMVEEKGLSVEAADRIGEFVQMSGGQVHWTMWYSWNFQGCIFWTCILFTFK